MIAMKTTAEKLMHEIIDNLKNKNKKTEVTYAF